MKVHVQLGHGFDAAQYGERYRKGETNDESPFGFHLARDLVESLSFSSDKHDRQDGRLIRWLNRKLRFDLLHAWHNRRLIANCDVVWTMAENDAFSLAALMKMGLIPRRPIVANAIWLFDQWNEVSPINRRIYTILSKYIDVLTVHSKACLPIAAQALPHMKVQLSYFGINISSYRIIAPNVGFLAQPIRILMAGNDNTRDWITALKAFGNDDRFVLSAWTKALDGDRQEISNLVLPKPGNMQEIIDLYLSNDIVVVPMKDNIFSGITVALEATALGKPVVSTNTGGIPTYFDAGQLTYVPVGDADALRTAVLNAGRDDLLVKVKAAQSRFLHSAYTTQAMIERYVEMSRPLLNRRAADAGKV